MSLALSLAGVSKRTDAQQELRAGMGDVVRLLLQRGQSGGIGDCPESWTQALRLLIMASYFAVDCPTCWASCNDVDIFGIMGRVKKHPGCDPVLPDYGLVAMHGVCIYAHAYFEGARFSADIRAR